jgi:hypothetical protein
MSSGQHTNQDQRVRDRHERRTSERLDKYVWRRLWRALRQRRHDCLWIMSRDGMLVRASRLPEERET